MAHTGWWSTVGCVALVVGLGCDLSGDMADAEAPSADSGSSEAGGGSANADYCAEVTDWDVEAIEFEEEVLVLVNEVREAGTTCGGRSMPAVPKLTMNEALRCAARVHSKDMVERNYFSHDSPEGEEPWDRFTQAGYAWRSAAENIAAGQQDPESVMASWLQSPGHCTNIMGADLVHIGVGLYERHWTQAFAAP